MHRVVKFIGTENRIIVARYWVGGGRVGMVNGESLFNGCRVLVLQDEKSYEDGWE